MDLKGQRIGTSTAKLVSSEAGTVTNLATVTMIKFSIQNQYGLK